MLTAIAHIVGTMLATVALGVIALLIDTWHRERFSKSTLQEIATRLGIPVDELNDEKHASKAVEFMSERFSNDRFSNRLSDLCGWLQATWGWLGALLQLGLLIGVIWLTVTDSLENAIYAWGVVAEGLFFGVTGALFAFFCRLFTGRYPGQARQVRKGLAELLNTPSNRSVITN
ncbi:hypothetical protein [Pseudomonas sp.]|uniref:hypothetical protein n=1 Tax=Pseudomonas sp. TaxID=306 RepID=UPI003F3BD67F